MAKIIIIGKDYKTGIIIYWIINKVLIYKRFFINIIIKFRTFIIFALPGKRVRIRGKKCIIESRIGPYQGVISSIN